MKISCIVEFDNRVMNHFQELFPNTPGYVIQDFIYPNYKHAPDQIEDDIIEWINSLSWKKEVVDMRIDMFDSFTQNRIKQLLGQDNERLKYQRDQISKTKSPSKEPIILTYDDGEYELQEGWHRTVESFRVWPDGYKQVAWVGY